MAGLDRVLRSSGGAITVVVLSIGALGWMILQVVASVHGDTPGDPSTSYFVCSETGKAFPHRNVAGEMPPILSPYSGKETGYPGEPCYWTADGGTKTEPTWVLLNVLVHKPGPTFCPDCGRLVVGHNPSPGEGVRVPPTMAEYNLAKNNNKGQDR